MKLSVACLIFGVAASAAFGQTPETPEEAKVAVPPPTYQYAAKFVCGTTPPAQGVPTLIAKGRYYSQTNVHNPSRYQTVDFRKKFAIALPFERVGKVSPYFTASLKADEALQIDCGDIFKHLGLPTTSFVEGFAVIETPLELDVDTVYTAGMGAAFDVSSIHTERVPPRRLQACNPLNLDITTGIAPWQVVAEQQPAGSLPRPANIYSPGVGSSNYIGGLPTMNTSDPTPRWWDLQICFCLCTGAQNVKLNLTAAAVDDTADFFLSNSQFQNQPLGQIGFNGATPAVLNAINNAATPLFRPGQNCLRARLTNLFPTVAGLSLVGSITGADAACPGQP